MRDHDDPVDAVVLAFLDHLEGVGERPTLDHLADDDRRRAEMLLDGLLAARGIDPRASRPSVESLLVDTPLAGLLPAVRAPAAGPAGAARPADLAGLADLATVRQVLSRVDRRARVEIEDGAVIYSYLDLRARFVLVPADTPVFTPDVRMVVERIFQRDADTSRVGLVAARSHDLTTLVLSPDDVGDTITTPRGEPHRRWDPPLPLGLAAQRLLEQSAPEWPAFDLDQARTGAFDLASVATEIARRVIEREAARSYRGDKKRAYKALVGHERIFADLVAKVSSHGTTVDLGRETARISQAAA
jgi:hypothetical protein